MARDVTAEFLGDPPLWRSALGKREGVAAPRSRLRPVRPELPFRRVGPAGALEKAFVYIRNGASMPAAAQRVRLPIGAVQYRVARYFDSIKGLRDMGDAEFAERLDLAARTPGEGGA